MVVCLAGENRFLVSDALSKLVYEFARDQGEMNIEHIDGEQVDPDELIQKVQALPFLGAKRLIVIRGATNNKTLAERLDEIIDNTADTTELVLVEGKLDKRSSVYKLLQKKTDLRELGELDATGLVRWLVQSAKEKGGKLSPSDAIYLVERVGANQLLASNELEKLLVYNPEVSRTTIDILTEPTPQSTIFELLDAAFSGKTKRALELYDDQRSQKTEAPVILGMIAWQLHILAIVKAAGHKPAAEIAKEAKLNPFVVNKSLQITKTLSLKRLRTLLKLALSIDVRLKTEPIDADEALKYFLVECSDPEAKIS